MTSVLQQVTLRANVVANAVTGAIADNTDIQTLCRIPAGRVVNIYDMRGYIVLASDTATDSIELVDQSNNILCQILIGSTGHVTALKADGVTAATFPIACPISSSEQILKLRSNGATDTSTEVHVEIHLDNPITS